MFIVCCGILLKVWGVLPAQFDEAIAPIQQSGLPFVYQDLPPIEVQPNFEALIT